MLTKLKWLVAHGSGCGIRLMLGVAASNTLAGTGTGTGTSSILLKRTLIAGVGAATLSRRPPMSSPWFLSQRRGAKVLGSDVRPGNIVQRKGRIYQVLKAQHTQHGRGGATIQVEMRDVDTGNKVTERFRTDEPLDRVYVDDKSYQYLYTEGDIVYLTDPETFEQVELPKELFGKAVVYLKVPSNMKRTEEVYVNSAEDMTVKVQYYDGRPMSATIPNRTTCTVVEAQPHTKGQSINPQYKRVLLDNGLTVLAPPFILTGDKIVVSTLDDSYLTRAK